MCVCWGLGIGVGVRYCLRRPKSSFSVKRIRFKHVSVWGLSKLLVKAIYRLICRVYPLPLPHPGQVEFQSLLFHDYTVL